jgi:DNA-binding Lrp family transcriptional regulator
MLDDFDLALLEEAQRDDGQTADALAKRVPLSPSAIARRLRRLRATGAIAGTIALLSRTLTERRLKALVFVVLSEHADLDGKAALQNRLRQARQVQFCYDLAGAVDMALLFDCHDMAEFNALCDGLLTADSTVRRYETHIVKREIKFAPFVALRESG